MLWLDSQAEDAAQLYMGCRCHGSIVCGAAWHAQTEMAQEQKAGPPNMSQGPSSSSRSKLSPRAEKEKLARGARAFDPRVLARVALLDVSLSAGSLAALMDVDSEFRTCPTPQPRESTVEAAFSQHRWRRAKSQSPISSTPSSAAPAPSATLDLLCRSLRCSSCALLTFSHPAQ